jgi:diguanylate cyclase (GGDEF)-like protein/putative nucleotidyltransferase with HDIG domain
VSWPGMDATREIKDPAVARRLRDAVDGCEKLPVLDRALQLVLTLADREETGVAELVDALEQDPALATNVLRFANSAANAVRMPIRTVRQAVSMVGRTGVRRLALDSVAYRFFERAPGNGGASSGHLHLHAVQVSRLAVVAAEHAGIGTDAPHLAGLLHDCGKLVMPRAFGSDLADAIAVAHRSGRARAAAERARIGVDHAQAGALLAAASGVDEAIVRAIAWHHGGDTGLVAPDRITACVQLADQVVGAVSGAELDRKLCDAALAVLGLPDEALDELAHAVGGDLRRAAAPASTVAEQIAALEGAAREDDLTGLATRCHWIQYVRARLQDGEQGGVVLLDVDDLTLVNESYGRRVGDVVLCEVARVAAARGFVGRLGDDEVAIWIPEAPSATAFVAEQVVRSVRTAVPLSAGPGLPPPRVTVSAGSAATRGDTTVEALLDLAGEALARAKREGRDRAVQSDVATTAA